MNSFFATLLFGVGLNVGLGVNAVLTDQKLRADMNRCDSESLQLLMQLNADRAAYFAALAECSKP